MIYYCLRGSPATEVDTNLQLYSLQKAADNWNDLIDAIEKQGNDDIYQLKERLVFILSCFGLSLVQLLGQNFPSPDDDPLTLLGNILVKNKVDRNTRNYLNSMFKEFLPYYDALRHFGMNKDEQNYSTINQLTVQKLDQFRRMTIKIWDVVIAIFKKDDKNNIETSSVARDIIFKDLTRT